jgi:hypothetical protein
MVILVLVLAVLTLVPAGDAKNKAKSKPGNGKGCPTRVCWAPVRHVSPDVTARPATR